MLWTSRQTVFVCIYLNCGLSRLLILINCDLVGLTGDNILSHLIYHGFFSQGYDTFWKCGTKNIKSSLCLAHQSCRTVPSYHLHIEDWTRSVNTGCVHQLSTSCFHSPGFLTRPDVTDKKSLWSIWDTTSYSTLPSWKHHAQTSRFFLH